MDSELPRPLVKETLDLPEKPSIAVLPFNNMSGDRSQEYFSDGLTEQIISGLSISKNLFVIARNSSFSYKGKSVDAKQITGELGVRYLLEGSVRRSENHIRINCQLINAVTGSHIWAQRFDRDLECPSANSPTTLTTSARLPASITSASVPTTTGSALCPRGWRMSAATRLYSLNSCAGAGAEKTSIHA